MLPSLHYPSPLPYRRVPLPVPPYPCIAFYHMMPFFSLPRPVSQKGFAAGTPNKGPSKPFVTEQAPRKLAWTNLGRRFTLRRKQVSSQRRHSVQEFGQWSSRNEREALPVSHLVVEIGICGLFPADHRPCRNKLSGISQKTHRPTWLWTKTMCPGPGCIEYSRASRLKVQTQTAPRHLVRRL